MAEPLLNKCGEVFTFQEANKNKFLIKCNYCDEKISNLAKFSKHYVKEHLESVLQNDALEAAAAKNSFSETSTDTNQHSDCDEFLFNVKVELNSFEEPAAEEDLNFGYNAMYERYHDSRIEENAAGCDSSLENYGNDDLDDGGSDNVNDDDRETYSKSDDSSDEDYCFSEEEKKPTKSNPVPKKRYRIFLETDRDLVLLVIEAYKNEPILWAHNYPYNKNKEKRTKAFENLERVIKNQTTQEISLEDINDMCNHFKLLARKDFSRLKYKRDTPWFLSKLDFLPKETNLEKIRTDSLIESGEPYLPMPDFTDEEHIRLINLYKRFPTLWNLNNPGFHSPAEKLEALKDLQKNFQQEFPEHGAEKKVELLINQIQLACSQEKQKKITAKQNKKYYKPFNKFANHLKFLDDYVSPFQCPKCSIIIKGFYMYHIHKSSHDGSKPFECSVCGGNSKSKENHIRHLMRHAKISPH